MKYVMLIGDGMGDHPIAGLGNRTPLQAAQTPAMDRLCSKSVLFGLATVPPGFHPGSDVANMSLLGYDPAKYYTGRAPLEAASMGISLAPDETAFRCNLVTLKHHDDGRTTMVDFSAGHISSGEAAELIAAVQEECGSDMFRFHAGISYRHLLVVRDPFPPMTPVPPHDCIGKDVSRAWQAYLDMPAWNELVRTAGRVLAEHPVNRQRRQNNLNEASGIWPWGFGKMPEMPRLASRFGIRGTMISAVDLLKGLGVCTGLDIANVSGATGYIDTNYEGKAQAALAALETQDFAFVHLEAPDEAGHQGRLDHKIQAIEDFDARIVAPITKALHRRQEPFRLIVTMDHFTPLSLRTHTIEPVPALLYDSRENEPGSGCAFDESVLQATKNPPLQIPGCTMINRLFERDLDL